MGLRLKVGGMILDRRVALQASHDWQHLCSLLSAASCSDALPVLKAASAAHISELVALRERRAILDWLKDAGIAPLGLRVRCANAIAGTA